MRIEDRSLPRIRQNLLRESRVRLKSATLVKISTDCCVLDCDWRAIEGSRHNQGSTLGQLHQI